MLLYARKHANKITLFIFLFLLFWRMVIFQRHLYSLEEDVQDCIVYGLISFVFWLNWNKLHSLNIDKNFIVIFICVGFLYSAIFPFFPYGICLLVLALINGLLFWNEAQLKSISIDLRQTTIFVVIFLVPLFISLIWQETAIKWPDGQTVYEAVFRANFPLVIFEEVIFRGLLWMFLVKASLGEYQIILIQALLFWLAHLYCFSQPYTFWFAVPFGGILLGIMVWRSKTITTSFLGHYIFNFLSLVFFQ